MILEMTLRSVVSKTSSKTEEKFHLLGPLMKLQVKYCSISLKQHLLPKCQSFAKETLME